MTLKSSTVILKRGNELLLILRKYEPFANHWALVGGAKQDGETFLQCAIREVEEEVGIHLRDATHVGDIKLAGQYSPVFSAEIFNAEAKIGEEVCEAKLFSHSELPTPIVPFHKEAIDRLWADLP